jgi:hypothetical protein
VELNYFGFNIPMALRRIEVSKMKPELMGNTPPEIMMKKYAIQMLELQIAEIYKSMEVE